MAKKKKRKETKKAPSYSVELKGILLILIAIIGCCPFGIVASLIRGFAGFLVGVWYIVLLIAVGVIGVYMMVKREKPDFLTSKLIGLYIMSLGVLILSHTGYIATLSENGITDFAVLEETINNLMGFINGQVELQGGGIIGAIFGVIFTDLLTLDGARVVCIALIICGLIMFTGVSIYDVVTYCKERAKEAKEKHINKAAERAARKAEEEAEEDDEEPVVVSEPEKEAETEAPKPEEIPEPSMDLKGYKLPATS